MNYINSGEKKMHNKIKIGKYQHYKGNFDQVEGVATHSA